MKIYEVHFRIDEKRTINGAMRGLARIISELGCFSVCIEWNRELRTAAAVKRVLKFMSLEYTLYSVSMLFRFSVFYVSIGGVWRTIST